MVWDAMWHIRKVKEIYEGFEACCVIGYCWMLHVGSRPKSNGSRANRN
jgi:hypothetical protein